MRKKVNEATAFYAVRVNEPLGSFRQAVFRMWLLQQKVAVREIRKFPISAEMQLSDADTRVKRTCQTHVSNARVKRTSCESAFKPRSSTSDGVKCSFCN